MSPVAFKVGDLARRTGLTVRTLHFYEEIGLLKPGERSDGGHRLYGPSEVARLQRITSLRQLGFTLEEIGDLLDGREGRPDVVIQRHIGQLREEIRRAQMLTARLEHLARRLQAGGELEVDDLLFAIEETIMHDKYFTEAQLAELERRRRILGDEGMARSWQAWAELIAEARTEQRGGTPPDAPKALDLARRWSGFIAQFTGDDPGVRDAVSRMWRENMPAMEERTGIDPDLRSWIGHALSAERRIRETRVATLRVPGATLHYHVRGAGPVLLMVQGGPGDADGWNGVADHLVAHYTVVTHDRRGLSRTTVDDPAEAPSPETHGDDAHLLLAALTDEPAFVVGCGIGALIGLDLIARYPEQVRALVAHAPPAMELLPDADRARAEQERADELSRREGRAAAMKQLAVSGVNPDDREPNVLMPRPSPRSIANIVHFLTRDVPAADRYRLDMAALETARTRIVAASGARDRELWISRCAYALAERLGMEMVEFPGGRGGCVTHPRAFAEKLREVLDAR